MKKQTEGYILIATLIILGILSMQLLFLGKNILIYKSAVENHYQAVKVAYLAKSGRKIAEDAIDLLPEWQTIPNKQLIYQSLALTYQPVTDLDGTLYLFKHTTPTTLDTYCIAKTNAKNRALYVFHYKKTSEKL
jgi:hypothetical protein